MSQFRHKKMDIGEVDEWVPRLNDDGQQIGDDVVAEDVNELSEAIYDIQTELLKTTSYAPSALLDANSGIVERLKILEETAGQAGLQDVYENSHIISVLSGKPLTFGVREEFKLDELGNLSFNPVTMRVKGSGVEYLEFGGDKVHGTLGPLSVGTVTAGYDFGLVSGQNMSFQDSFLAAPVTLAEAGATVLDTTSQSIVGAINELKSTAFNVSMQAVYDQSTPPKIETNLTRGSFIVEDPNSNPLFESLKILGNQSVSGWLSSSEFRAGSAITIDDTNGISSTLPIKTTSEIETPIVKGEGIDLTLSDSRIALALSEGLITSLGTSSQSLAGAINELKAQIDSVGGAASFFGIDHDAATGYHKYVRSQAPLAQDGEVRIDIMNSVGDSNFTVTGAGDVHAKDIDLDGIDVRQVLQDAIAHHADDGTSHAIVQGHLIANNPHNTVGTLNGETGDINIVGDIGVSVYKTGSTIHIGAVDTSNIQSVYGNSLNGDLVLDTDGGKNYFFRNSASDILLGLRDTSILFNRDISLEHTTPKVTSTNTLELEAQTSARLTSVTEDVVLEAQDATKTVVIEGIPFSSPGATSIHEMLPQDLLGALELIAQEKFIKLTNHFNFAVTKGQAVYLDLNNRIYFPINSIHPANIYSLDFYHENEGSLMIAAEDIPAGAEGNFVKQGQLTAVMNTAGLPWNRGSGLFLARRGFMSIEVKDVTALNNLDEFIIDSTYMDKPVVAVTGVPNQLNGEYKIENTGNANLDSDKTRDNMITTLNNYDFQSISVGLTPPVTFFSKAVIDGQASKGKLELTANLVDGNLVQIQPDIAMIGAEVTLEAKTSPDPKRWFEFAVGSTKEETAKNLMDCINRTTFKSFSYDEAPQGILPATEEGHYCKATEVIGSTVCLEWYKPGLSGREVGMVVSTPNITVHSFMGGTCELKLYRQEFSSSVMVSSNTNTLALEVSDFYGDEFDGQYITEREAKDESRKLHGLYPHEKEMRVAHILDVSGSTLKIQF